MKVYLDICCLKRPFDDASQARIAVETAAVQALLRAEANGDIALLRSAAHLFENARDPDLDRRGAVQAWIEAGDAPVEADAGLKTRFQEFRVAGLDAMDALHLAWAERLGAAVLLTTDDRFLNRTRRLSNKLMVKVMNPVVFVQEIGYEHDG